MTDTTTTAPAVRHVGGRPVPEPGTYALDGAHTVVGFVARHLMISKVRGSFSDVEGTVTIAEEPTESSLAVTVQTASVHTRDDQRDGHLRSADFFDVEQHPTMTYRSTAVRPADAEDRWHVDGELTVRDVTRPVALEVTFEGASEVPEAMGGGTSIGFSATGKVDREAFGLTWNVPLEKGGVLVGKEVTLEIEAEAIQQG